MSRTVAIVGGGITGLSAAYDLQNAGFEVDLFEQGSTLGGKLRTVQEGDLLIELGPDSIFATKPWAVDLMCEIGLEDELIEPLGHEFSILTKGKLHSVPRALASLMPAASEALEKAGFLSAAAKRRVLQESEVKAGTGRDESVASFFSRRFGRTFSALLAEPLLAGTHAGDPHKLSMAALYPAYLGMERSHGSLSGAASARAGSGGNSHRRPGFLSLKRGMAALPERLAEKLDRARIHLSTEVASITANQGRAELMTSIGNVEADHAIVTTPAHASARLLGGEVFGSIRFASTAIATLAYHREGFRKPVTGNGFLVPYTEPSIVTGSTFSSNKWPGRAPEDVLLLRVFMGRDTGPDVDGIRDLELTRLAEEMVSGLLKPKHPPFFSRLDRWSEAMPQYELGHLERVAAIEESLAGSPITVAGASYRGNSISDCVRQGREAAEKLIECV